eukprot:54654-Eustigmatos_ZCMA.PRE.1
MSTSEVTTRHLMTSWTDIGCGVSPWGTVGRACGTTIYSSTSPVTLTTWLYIKTLQPSIQIFLQMSYRLNHGKKHWRESMSNLERTKKR